jgi:hypothetical protein
MNTSIISAPNARHVWPDGTITRGQSNLMYLPVAALFEEHYQHARHFFRTLRNCQPYRGLQPKNSRRA